jgi:alpha-tubulin suppressor-like RCC1 family protein
MEISESACYPQDAESIIKSDTSDHPTHLSALNEIEQELIGIKEQLNKRGLGQQYRESLVQEGLNSILQRIQSVHEVSKSEEIENDRILDKIAYIKDEVDKIQHAEKTCMPSEEVQRMSSFSLMESDISSGEVNSSSDEMFLSVGKKEEMQSTAAESNVYHTYKTESPDTQLIRMLSRDRTCDIDTPYNSKSVEVEISTSSIYSWGRSDLGSLFPASLSSKRIIRQISSNAYHSAAVTTTGELYLCGSNDEGQIDSDKTIINVIKPRLCESLYTHRIQQVSCGLTHTACLTSSGLCLTFGGNEVGELGHSPGSKSFVPPRIVEGLAGKIAIQVSCGDHYTLVLTQSGEVLSCGVGAINGHRHGENLSRLERIESLLGASIIQVSAGSTHALALSSSGVIYGWGSSSYGQLGQDDAYDNVQVPTVISSPNQAEVGIVIGISAGYSHTIVWTDKGILLGCGLNKYGQLALSLPRVSNLTPLGLELFCLKAACGSNHTIVLCKDSDEGTVVLAFGSNSFGQVDDTSTSNLFRNPVIVPALKDKQTVFIGAGGDTSYAISGSSNTVTSVELHSALEKKYSIQTVRAIGPLLHATDFIAALQAANEAEQLSLTSNAIALFSSLPLLSTSFYSREKEELSYHSEESNINIKALNIDDEGIDSCFCSLLTVGGPSLPSRLMASINISIQDLELIFANADMPTATIDGALRALIILLLCPLNSNISISEEFIRRFCSLFNSRKIPLIYKQIICNTIATFSPHIFASRLVAPLQRHLTR